MINNETTRSEIHSRCRNVYINYVYCSSERFSRENKEKIREKRKKNFGGLDYFFWTSLYLLLFSSVPHLNFYYHASCCFWVLTVSSQLHFHAFSHTLNHITDLVVFETRIFPYCIRNHSSIRVWSEHIPIELLVVLLLLQPHMHFSSCSSRHFSGGRAWRPRKEWMWQTWKREMSEKKNDRREFAPQNPQ